MMIGTENKVKPVSKDSMAPAAMAGRTLGKVIRRRVRQGFEPLIRAASSKAGSRLRSPALTTR